MPKRFDFISGPMSVEQFFADESYWATLTSVQRVVFYRDKWANKHVVWEAILSDVIQSGQDIELSLNIYLGYSYSDDPDSDYSKPFHGYFSVRISNSTAEAYLNFNKGDTVVIKGILPPELQDIRKTDLLINCTAELRPPLPPTPEPKKKSFLGW